MKSSSESLSSPLNSIGMDPEHDKKTIQTTILDFTPASSIPVPINSHGYLYKKTGSNDLFWRYGISEKNLTSGDDMKIKKLLVPIYTRLSSLRKKVYSKSSSDIDISAIETKIKHLSIIATNIGNTVGKKNDTQLTSLQNQIDRLSSSQQLLAKNFRASKQTNTSNIQDQIIQLDTKVNNLNSLVELNQVNNTPNDLQSQIDTLYCVINENKTSPDIHDYVQRIDDLSSEISQAVSTSEYLQSQITNINSNISSAKQVSGKDDGIIAALQAKFTRLNNNFLKERPLDRKLKNKIDKVYSLMMASQESSGSYKQLSIKINNLSDKIKLHGNENLQNQIDKLSIDIADNDNSASFDLLHTQIVQIKSVTDNLSEASANHIDNDKFNNKINSLENKNLSLENKISFLEEKNKSLADKNTAIINKNNALEQDIKSISSLIDTYNEQIINKINFMDDKMQPQINDLSLMLETTQTSMQNQIDSLNIGTSPTSEVKHTNPTKFEESDDFKKIKLSVDENMAQIKKLHAVDREFSQIHHVCKQLKATASAHKNKFADLEKKSQAKYRDILQKITSTTNLEKMITDAVNIAINDAVKPAILNAVTEFKSSQLSEDINEPGSDSSVDVKSVGLRSLN